MSNAPRPVASCTIFDAAAFAAPAKARPAPVHNGAMKPLRPGLWLEVDGSGGGIVHGAPSVLSEICAHLGFRNSCHRGRVYITGPKVARLESILATLFGSAS